MLRRHRRQLQDGRNLTGTQPSQQYDLAVGELKRIVMRVRATRVDSSKLSNFSDDQPASMKEFVLHVFLECDFRAWKQTHCNPKFFNRSEPTGY